MTTSTRRTFLKVGAATGASFLFSTAAGTAEAATRSPKRVYVVVVDGCSPGEIEPVLTPRLAALRAAGTHFPRAQSLPVMETIPNHVMMMSGVRPDRSRVPANSVYVRAEGVIRDLDRPSDLGAPTLLERLPARGFTTGSVLSKEYLFGIFGTRATYRWEPKPLIPITDHAPDVATMDATLAMIDSVDPNLVFVNLGDCDRVGHSDLSGTTLRAARTAALTSADTQVGRLVDKLRSTGRWSRSVVVVLADHSMDWSRPDSLITLQPHFDADPMLAGRVVIADNGGADLVYWTGPAAGKPAAVQRIRSIAAATPGVLSTHLPSELRVTSLAGDVIVYCKAGYRFSDPSVTSNPIPGNHGHPATLPIPFFVSGGSPLVVPGTSSTAAARTVDVAPTVGKVFGLPAPSGGYDGTARL
jgi:hypothetical protein